MDLLTKSDHLLVTYAIWPDNKTGVEQEIWWYLLCYKLLSQASQPSLKLFLSLCCNTTKTHITSTVTQSGHLLWKYQPSFIALSPYIASLSLHAHWDCLRATYTSLRYLALPNTMSLLSKLHRHIKETDSYMGKDILMYCAARPPTLSLIVALCFPTLPAQDFLIILSTFLEESFNFDESNISTHSQT